LLYVHFFLLAFFGLRSNLKRLYLMHVSVLTFAFLFTLGLITAEERSLLLCCCDVEKKGDRTW